MSNRKTIKQIAEVTGYSTATVDRVINGRDGVKDETRRRILLAARELSYKNVAIRAPEASSGQILKTVLIIPDTDNELINNLGMAIQAKSLTETCLTLNTYRYKNLNSSSLVEVLLEVQKSGADVIGLVGIDDPQVSVMLNRLQKDGKKVITLLSVISGITPWAHIGINDSAAGRTAGLLMAKNRPDSSGVVLVFTGSTQYQGHLQREIGFRGILRESGIPVRIAESYAMNEDRSHTTALALQHLKDSKDVSGVYVIGSGAAEIIDAMDQINPAKRPVVICHDMTESVINKLVTGKVDYVIHQDHHVEASNFIKTVRNLFEDKEPVKDTLPVRINIVTAENIYSDEI
ncbi:LacI family DNA-binding transcriptional regulator [Pantoea rwandensis]|uniref:HTH lacI-type domain-containing protein n=1 Tax=Pantoea rwandensis TaxID=1076550 RepID=A0A1X1D3G0_9GAMM|nr:LacI family DNA-binding transcriptional regulator [Pantoea rwandensis]ORM71208.1 hypothetical protein HA51_04865 [Pantoea rwandensis]